MTAPEALGVPHTASLTVKDFIVLAESGAFSDYARAELIDGEILVVNAQFRRHARIRRKLVRAFEDALAGRTDGLGVVDECSIAIDDGTMLQPDITLTTEPDEDGPVPLASVRLIVEVADSTLPDDTGRKKDKYAECGVPEYWVVDVKGSLILRHWSPVDGAFSRDDKLACGEVIEAMTIEGLSIDTEGLRRSQ